MVILTFEGIEDYLFPPSVPDWLPENHLARFILEVIDRLDLTQLTQAYGGRGSTAFERKTYGMPL